MSWARLPKGGIEPVRFGVEEESEWVGVWGLWSVSM